MDLFVPPSLILHVSFDDFFVGVLPHRVHVEAACPEVASPEDFLDVGMLIEDVLGREALDDLRYGAG